jgi:hypothetical protein
VGGRRQRCWGGGRAGWRIIRPVPPHTRRSGLAPPGRFRVAARASAGPQRTGPPTPCSARAAGAGGPGNTLAARKSMRSVMRDTPDTDAASPAAHRARWRRQARSQNRFAPPPPSTNPCARAAVTTPPANPPTPHPPASQAHTPPSASRQAGRCEFKRARCRCKRPISNYEYVLYIIKTSYSSCWDVSCIARQTECDRCAVTPTAYRLVRPRTFTPCLRRLLLCCSAAFDAIQF